MPFQSSKMRACFSNSRYAEWVEVCKRGVYRPSPLPQLPMPYDLQCRPTPKLDEPELGLTQFAMGGGYPLILPRLGWVSYPPVAWMGMKRYKKIEIFDAFSMIGRRCKDDLRMFGGSLEDDWVMIAWSIFDTCSIDFR